MARRIRKRRVILFILFVIAFFTLLYYIITFFVNLVSGLFLNNEKDSTDKPTAVTEKMVREDVLMMHRLDSLMRSPQRLDTNLIAVNVYDLTTQREVYAVRDEEFRSPASCMKIATALAAIESLGIDYRFRESLQIRGKMHGDTLVGNLLVKADDDPLLESFDSLLMVMKNRGVRNIRGNIYYDLAREDTLRPHPTAKTWDIPYHRTPLLLKGVKYIQRQFRYNLGARGINFRDDPSVKPEGRYRYVASSSHKLTDVLTPMLVHSSNIKADAILYHLNMRHTNVREKRIDWTKQHYLESYLRERFEKDSTSTYLRGTQKDEGFSMSGFVINDGSGLSPENRMNAYFLVRMLRYIYSQKGLREYFIREGLASPGDPRRTGSLLTRMSRAEYRGKLFCKTGTQVTIGTSSLAGFLHARDGHWYAFAIINSNSPVAEARMFQDRMCKMMMK